MRRAKYVFITMILIVFIVFLLLGLGFPDSAHIQVGTYTVLTLTLVALVIYAFDMHRIAEIDEKRWEEQLKPRLMYEIKRGKTDEMVLFRLINTSDYWIRAQINCNFKIYSEKITYSPEYNGTQEWSVWPGQVFQGWFSLQTLLAKKGLTVEKMKKQRDEANERQQLTMDLDISCENEMDRSRIYPTRHHYLSFERMQWIPDVDSG